MGHGNEGGARTPDARWTPGPTGPAGLPTPDDDTDARWEPIPDEVWFTSPAGRPVAPDADGTDAGLDLPIEQATTDAPTTRVPDDPTRRAPADATRRVSPAPPADGDRTVVASVGPTRRAPSRADSAFPVTAPGGDWPPEAPADRTQLVGAGNPYQEARPAAGVAFDGATVRRQPARPPAERTQVVGAGNPYPTAQPGARPGAAAPAVDPPDPDAPGRTQVWAAPYAGAAAGAGGGSDGTAPNATATARRPSLLRRRRDRRATGGVGQIPYGASADGPRGPYDGSPMSPAENGPEPRRRWRDRKRARHGCLSLLLWLVMLVVVGLMALRTLPSHLANGRMVPELVAFVPWLFAPIIVCLALALLWRRRLLAVCCAAALAVMAWWHAGFFVPTARVSQEAVATVAASASTEDNAARVMTVNTNNGMASASEIVEICREQNVEVLCLQELGGSMLDDLEAAGIDEVLPYHVVSDEATQISNGGRNGIWSAAPIGNVSTNLLPIETSSMPAADIVVGGRVVRVVSVHPNSPVRGAQDLWDDGLATIGQLQGYDHAYLIMGDFNSTWDHARFRELLGTSFVDAGQQSGEGFHMTFPSEGPVPPAVELDHIVYARDSGIVVSELETRHVSGTDHMALLGTLEAQ